MRPLLRAAKWETPYRHAFFWLVASLVAFAITSGFMWFGGFLGILVALVAAFVLIVSWVIVFAAGLRAAWVRRLEPRRAFYAGVAAVGALVLAFVVALPVMWAVAWSLDWASFLTNQTGYREVVRLAQKGGFDPSKAGYQEYEGTEFMLDAGPPIRVAFPMPGGFLDNWSGVIYDPTGEVMLADGFDARTGEFVAPEHITKLFYGDIVSCRHMLGDFYRCSFT